MDEDFMFLNNLEPGFTPLQGITYQMFTLSGQPGYYMLYSDLINAGEDEHHTKGDQTLE